jgi:hypothetical protein
MANENPEKKTEKPEAPAASDGISWRRSLKLFGIGAASTAAGVGAAYGVGALAKKAFGRQIADEGNRQAAAFGSRIISAFGRR